MFVEHAIGSLERPITDAQLEAKFRDLAEPVIGAGQADKLIEACRRLGEAEDVEVRWWQRRVPEPPADAGSAGENRQ